MKVIPLRAEHIHDVAVLHIQGISSGFISSLGINFVTALYEAIAQSRESFGFAAEDKYGRVLGFVTLATNLDKLYKSVIAKKGWRFVLLLAGRMFSFKSLRKMLETLFYSRRMNQICETDLPATELLSIVVDPVKYHTGVATQLLQTSLEHCRKVGLDEIKVLVASNNIPANKFYLKCGFKFIGQVNNHSNVVSNVYEADVDEALREIEYKKKLSNSCSASSGPSKEKLSYRRAEESLACVA